MYFYWFSIWDQFDKYLEINSWILIKTSILLIFVFRKTNKSVIYHDGFIKISRKIFDSDFSPLRTLSSCHTLFFIAYPLGTQFQKFFSFPVQVFGQVSQQNCIVFPIWFPRKILFEWETGVLVTMIVVPIVWNGLLACDCHAPYDIVVLCTGTWKAINEEIIGACKTSSKEYTTNCLLLSYSDLTLIKDYWLSSCYFLE